MKWRYELNKSRHSHHPDNVTIYKGPEAVGTVSDAVIASEIVDMMNSAPRLKHSPVNP